MKYVCLGGGGGGGQAKSVYILFKEIYSIASMHTWCEGGR